MEVIKVLHMNGGKNEISYASNSALQKKAISLAKPILEEAILAMCSKTSPESLGIADLGCSSGPNTFCAISNIINSVHRVACELHLPPAEFRVYLNDLPGNDFNAIFEYLPTFVNKIKEKKQGSMSPFYVAGVAGSFYGRLFAKNSLHFVHSSYSLMWLSQVPPELDSITGEIKNKGNIYMAETSPPEVFKAYLEQFKKDFSVFLRSRSEELISGGTMVLTLLGRTTGASPSSKECCYIWELLAKALRDMASQGFIDEEKLDSFNLPQYTPSPPEVEELIKEEGSFKIHKLETYEVSWVPEDKAIQNLVYDHLKSGEKVAKYMRAVAEPLLRSHFGGGILDDLFRRYRDNVTEYMEIEEAKFINLVISVERT